MSSVPSLAASIAAAAEATESAHSQIPESGSMMQAAARHRYGGPVETVEIDRPTPAANQVLVAVHTAAIDRGTSHVHTGTPYLMRLAGFGFTKPKQPVLGMDLSGTVVEVGSDVTRFAVGDEVFGIGSGTFAECAVADECKLSHRPANVPHSMAAPLSISGSTALQALRDHGQVQPGQSVLIIGASGGVGSFAVQLAKHFGATVTGVASTRKLEMVRALGADRMIDYTSTDVVAEAQANGSRFDLIIDIGGRIPVRQLRKILAGDGTLVIVGGEGGNDITGGISRQLRAAALSPFVSHRLKFFIAVESHEHADVLADLAAAGVITAAVNHRYGLDGVGRALEDLASGRISGKAVVEVQTGALQ